MRICGSQPRLAVSIAPKVAFSGLFCETLEARLVPTRRGDVRVHKNARERDGRAALCALGERTAENRFLLVTDLAFFEVAGRRRRAMAWEALPLGWHNVGTRIRRTTPARIARSGSDRAFCLFCEWHKIVWSAFVAAESARSVNTRSSSVRGAASACVWSSWVAA